MLSLQARVAEDVEDGPLVFCRRLATLLSSLAAAQQQGVSEALNEFMAPLQNSFAAFKN